jgi:[ribosomal protein S5]-alanine N-acetyltransferase
MKIQPINFNEDKSSEIYASPDCQELLKIYDDYYPKIGFNPPWIGYFVIRENQVVGCGGFTGKPTDGKVEIAYATFQPFEGQGVASFTCSQLISISQTTDPTIIITAKTAPENNASTKILGRNGFVFSGIVQDEEIGDAWLWILPN